MTKRRNEEVERLDEICAARPLKPPGNRLEQIVADVNAEFQDLAIRNVVVIRRARWMFNMSTTEIAEELGMSQSAIVKAEKRAKRDGY